MFNITKKTLLIIVVISTTIQFQDFAAEDHYYKTLSNCFALNGDIVAGNGDLRAAEYKKQERDEMYLML